MSAGTETSSQTLEVAVFNLLDGPAHMLDRLKGELRQVMPEKRMTVELASLEKLPYLVWMLRPCFSTSWDHTNVLGTRTAGGDQGELEAELWDTGTHPTRRASRGRDFLRAAYPAGCKLVLFYHSFNLFIELHISSIRNCDWPDFSDIYTLGVAQVLVASSTYVHHMNRDIFPSPEEFRPERWLDGDPKLEQYLVSFSRGSRACIGIK